jgi:hypothetical protein
MADVVLNVEAFRLRQQGIDIGLGFSRIAPPERVWSATASASGHGRLPTGLKFGEEVQEAVGLPGPIALGLR